MTVEEVNKHVRLQAGDALKVVNDHRIILADVLVPPRKILVIERTVRKGRIKDREFEVWLIGQERTRDGYKIIMREDGSQFGLSSSGFLSDSHPILCGWYGSLLSAFLGM